MDGPLQVLDILGEASTKSKPPERVGRKATDLLDNARKGIVYKGKPGAIPGRKATGLLYQRQPGCRRQSNGGRVARCTQKTIGRCFQ